MTSQSQPVTCNVVLKRCALNKFEALYLMFKERNKYKPSTTSRTKEPSGGLSTVGKYSTSQFKDPWGSIQPWNKAI